MRLGTVIGRVTLSQSVPQLKGARWLLISPFNRKHFQQGHQPLNQITDEPSLVIYDNLGGGVGIQWVLWKAEKPPPSFDPPIPIDAINAALVDETFYTPKEDA